MTEPLILPFCRTWTPKTRMRIPWTNWRDRRLCPVVFAKATIGPPAVRTRTPWAPCRRSWLNSSDFPPQTRKSLLALVPSALQSHHQILICFSWSTVGLDGWLFFSFSSWTRACSACTEQDWEVCTPEPEGWRHAEGRVHAAQPQRWV